MDSKISVRSPVQREKPVPTLRRLHAMALNRPRRLIRGIRLVLHRYLERETIARKIEFPNPPPAVIFLIPLLPKSQAKNWDLVGSQLEKTLGSLLSQDHDS